MNLTFRPSTGLTRLFSDLPSTLLDRDFFDVESDLTPMRLGVNIPSVNIRETAKDYILEVAAPGLERKDFNIEIPKLEERHISFHVQFQPQNYLRCSRGSSVLFCQLL